MSHEPLNQAARAGDLDAARAALSAASKEDVAVALHIAARHGHADLHDSAGSSIRARR